jgi:hypothetical protein
MSTHNSVVECLIYIQNVVCAIQTGCIRDRIEEVH